MVLFSKTDKNQNGMPSFHLFAVEMFRERNSPASPDLCSPLQFTSSDGGTSLNARTLLLKGRCLSRPGTSGLSVLPHKFDEKFEIVHARRCLQ